MAVKDSNERITITISKELLKKVDTLADYQTATRNSVINNLISMSIDAQIQLWQMMKDPNMLSNIVNLASSLGNADQLKDIDKLKDYLNSNDKEKIKNVKKVNEMFTAVNKKEK